MMNTARKNVVNASTFTKPPKYRPVTGANRGAASAATRPATAIAGSHTRADERGSSASTTSTTQAVIATMSSGAIG